MGKDRDQRNPNGHRIRKRVLTGLVLVVGGVIVLLIATKLWIGPLIIENRIASHVGRVCNGDVRVQNTQFGLGGQIAVGDVIVDDAQGRPRIRVSDLRLNVDGMAHLNPHISTVTVESLEVDLHRGQEPLIKESRPPSRGNVSLQSLDIRNIAIRMHAEDAAVTWLDDAHLSAKRKEGGYEVSLKQDSDPNGGPVQITGTIDPDFGQLQLETRIKRAFDANQVSVLLSWANLPSDLGGRGQLEADLQLGGTYADLTNIETNGHVNLTDAAVSYRGAPVLSDLAFRCDVNDSHLRGQLESQMLRGTLNGTLRAQHAGLIMGSARLELQADGADLSQLASNVPDWNSVTKGIASGRYDARFRHPALTDVNGSGVIHIEKMDVQLLPIVSQIFEVLNVKALGASDAMVQFDNQGPAMTINDGSIANAVNAVKIEPGGRVNLEDHHVDLYAIWMPLKQAESLLKKVPLANLLTDIKDKLVRVHVEGQWDQPASKLISKEPVKDVSEAVTGFFKDVVTTGGSLPKTMFDALKSIGGQ